MKNLIIAFIFIFWMVGCSELQVSYLFNECVSEDIMNTKECVKIQTMRDVLNLVYMVIVAVIVFSTLFFAVKNRPKN